MVNLKQESFGEVKGQPVSKFTWTTDTGFSVSAITYGAIITNILVKDEHGELADVVLGFDDLQSILTRKEYHIANLGAVVGRCAYSIADGKFSIMIGGVTYNLTKNLGSYHIHGGIVGFDKVVWTPTVHGTSVTMSYLSRDGEEGYPGDLVTSITYTVTEDGALEIDYIATTTKTTVVNLTNHSYFNLAGHASGSQELYEHFFVINADKTLEKNSIKNLIPTGRFLDVRGTPYDLRSARKLGDVINTGSNLFDDYFCVKQYDGQDLSFMARAQHTGSGRYMEAYSNQPGLQFFTSNYLPASGPGLLGKSGAGYHRHGAFCFNIQTYPDAVHHENFPTSILRPGQVYRQKTKYVFGAEKSVPCVVPE